MLYQILDLFYNCTVTVPFSMFDYTSIYSTFGEENRKLYRFFICYKLSYSLNSAITRHILAAMATYEIIVQREYSNK